MPFFAVFETLSAQNFSAYQELLNKFLKEEISEEKGIRSAFDYDSKNGTLYLTRLFNWYEEDFAEDAGSNLNFLLKYVSESEREILKNEKLKIKYHSYDWSLDSPSNIFIP